MFLNLTCVKQRIGEDSKVEVFNRNVLVNADTIKFVEPVDTGGSLLNYIGGGVERVVESKNDIAHQLKAKITPEENPIDKILSAEKELAREDKKRKEKVKKEKAKKARKKAKAVKKL